MGAEAIPGARARTGVKNTGPSRRAFVGGAAAAGAALLVNSVSGGAFADDATTENRTIPKDEIYTNHCHTNCANQCFWDVHVRDGYVVDLTAHEYDDDPGNFWHHGCPRVYMNIQNMYDAERILHPMRRVGERGSGQWEQITWDEAIQTIADVWNPTLEEVGGAGLGFWSIAGNWAALNGSVRHVGAWDRLRSLLAANRIYDSADWGGMYVFSQMCEGTGFRFGNMGTAENVVFWNNGIETFPNTGRRMEQARANGAKVTCIDPVFTSSAALSDEYIGIKPATDSYLALACVNWIIENGMENTSFLKTRSCGPLLVRDDDGRYLRVSDVDESVEPGGDGDGFVAWDEEAGRAVPFDEITSQGDFAAYEPLALRGAHSVAGIACRPAFDLLAERASEYTVDRAVEVCGVPREQIVDLATGYATKRTFTSNYLGLCHYINGPQMYMAQITLFIVTGNIAMPHTGDGYMIMTSMGWSSEYANPGKAAEIPEGVGAPLFGSKVEPNGQTNATDATGRGFCELDLPEVMETGVYDNKELPLRSVVAWCGNVIGGGVEPGAFIEAIDKLELFIVTATRMNDTARQADLILPLAHWFEVEDISGNHKSPYARFLEKCVEPPEDCLSDFEMVQRIASAIGLGKYFDHTPQDALRRIIDTPGNAALGISYDTLKEKKAIRFNDDNDYAPVDGMFKTQTKKLQFYFEDMPSRWPNSSSFAEYDPDEYRLPKQQFIGEVFDEETAKKYPLIILTPHSKYSSQTTLSDQPWLMEILESPKLHINPVDAEAAGIADGDLVRAYNDRGECVFTAKINNGCQPGVVLHYHGMRKVNFVKGHYQELTSLRHDALTKNTCYNDTRVAIEKYVEEGK